MDDEQTTRETNKICGVCGDRALGYNFNAVSCESCKAFFRRNALKNKDFRCPFTENCDVTPITRRFCQKCRLDKCFTIGMRKEYIMTEEDKVLKRNKIEENRAKKRSPSGGRKNGRTKRENAEDLNFDNENSMTSGLSVKSTVSEGYLYECRENFGENESSNFEGSRRQSTVDNMSPATAASVPSPSSPPESQDIAGTKTLEMLKNSVSTNSERRGKRSIDTSEVGGTPGTKRKFVAEKKKERNMEYLSGNATNFAFVNFTPSTSNGSRLPIDSLDYADDLVTHCGDKSRTAALRHDLESENSQKVLKTSCPKSIDLVDRLKKNPRLFVKLIEIPAVRNAILDDKNLIMKLLGDENVVAKLTEDPTVLNFCGDTTGPAFSKVTHSEIIDNMLIDDSDDHVDNPVLTSVIAKTVDKSYLPIKPEVKSNWEETASADLAKDVLQDVETIPIAANSIESILGEAIKLEFSAYSAMAGNQNGRELNDVERAKLNELIIANKALLAPLDDDITGLIGDECPFKGTAGNADPMLLDVINLTAIAIRRLIKMSKKINAFKNMCQEDQLALLKGGCTEMMILRSALTYDSDRDMWEIPYSQERMSNIKVDVLKEAKGNLYSEHERFVRTFDPRWRDENIILILSAIALFSPSRPRVVHNDVIRLEQNSYYYLLRRYLESVFPGCEAKSTFLKLIQKISELHKLNEEVVGVYLNVNPSSVEPLLIEIFDLKH